MAAQPNRVHTTDFLFWVMIGTTVFFYPSAMDVFNFPKQWLLVCLTIGMIIHFCLGGKANRNQPSKETKIIGFLLFVTAIFMVIASVFSDTTLVRSLFGYPGRAGGLLVFFSILSLVWVSSRVLLPEDFDSKLKSRVLVTFFLVSLYSLIQLLNLDPVPWNNPYNRVIGTFGNPNFSGAYLGTASAVVLALALHSTGKQKRALFTFSAVLLGLAVATESIQALGIFLIGAIIQGLMFAQKQFSKRHFLLIMTLLGVFSSIIFLSLLGFGPLGQSLYQYTLRLRLEYWRVGLEIARNFPLTGMGPDSYVEGFRLFRGVDFVGAYSQNVIADSAHNVPINFMANFGVPAFLCLAALILLISIKAWKVLFNSQITMPGVKMASLVWILLLIQSFFSLEQIGLSVTQWVCGSLLLNPQFTSNRFLTDKPNKSSERNKGSNVLESLKSEIAVVSVVLCMVISWSLMKQEISLSRLASTQIGTPLAEADVQKQISEYNSFVMDEVRRVMYVSNFLLSVQRYDQAQVFLENSVSKDPDAYEGLEQLARLAAVIPSRVSELEYRLRIEDIDPYNYTNLLSISQIYEKSGRKLESKRYAKKVLNVSRDPMVNESATVLLQKD